MNHQGAEPKNQLLRKLSKEHLSLILKSAELVHLDLRDDSIKPNAEIQFVDFPESGVISFVTPMGNGSLVEIATVGNEGFIGTSVLLDVTVIPEWAFCQVEATAWRIKIENFKLLLAEIPEFRKVCGRYAATFFNQVARNMGCNATHSIEKRCARWLLSTHDRVGQDHFYLTQEFLAMMLNVTRAGVNIAAGNLQKAKLINYSRGNVSIVNRAGLEKVCCPCYDAVNVYFEETCDSSDATGSGLKGTTA